MKQERQNTRVKVNDEYSFSRYKLPKSLSYPLKRSLLDASLRSASVYDVVWFVQYYDKPYPRASMHALVLRALFSPEQDRNFGAGRVFIGLWPVAAQQRQAIEQLLIDQGLNTLCLWLAKVRAEGNAWRSMQHTLELSLDGGTLRVVEQ